MQCDDVCRIGVGVGIAGLLLGFCIYRLFRLTREEEPAAVPMPAPPSIQDRAFLSTNGRYHRYVSAEVSIKLDNATHESVCTILFDNETWLMQGSGHDTRGPFTLRGMYVLAPGSMGVLIFDKIYPTYRMTFDGALSSRIEPVQARGNWKCLDGEGQFILTFDRDTRYRDH